MGWTSYHAKYYDRRGQIDRKRECDAYWLEGLNTGHFAVVRSAMVGSTYYAAIRPLKRRTGKDDLFELIPEEEQKTHAVVFLTLSNNRTYYNFSYKDMDESVGPAATECPVGILKCLSDTENETALAWRKACMEHAKTANRRQKSRKILNGLPAFSWIRFQSDDDYGGGTIHKGDTITLQKRNAGSRTIWSDGHYRWPVKLIPTDFTVVEH